MNASAILIENMQGDLLTKAVVWDPQTRFQENE
jgi:hypothetical protein